MGKIVKYQLPTLLLSLIEGERLCIIAILAHHNLTVVLQLTTRSCL